MLRKCTIGLFVVACAMAIFIEVRGKGEDPPTGAKSGPLQVPSEPKMLKPASPLPISQVVLFNSGVGYFQRTGQVEGDARVDLQFQTSDINDLIKSLLVEDAKGKVLPLRYDSQEPVEKTLRSFAINLSGNPSYGEILNQARGEKVELTLVANNTGLPGTLSGAIIGMESGQRLPTPSATTTADIECVNLMCAEGLRTVPVNQIQRLRFLNPAIENELRRALEVVATGHDSQKKVVRLGFRGEGKRDVKVGYVTENPIWKTSYRIVMDKNGKTKLLGWANIENTSDEDWHDIKLTLVSGRPISFQMDLYPPLFIPRPTVEPDLFASLRPPTYAGPLVGSGFAGQVGTPVVFNGNMGGFGAFGGGMQGGMQGGFNGVGRAVPGQIDSPMDGQGGFAAAGAGGVFNGGGNFNGFAGQFQGGFGGQFQGGQLGNRYQSPKDVGIVNPKMTFKDLQQRRLEKQGPQQESEKQARQIGSILTDVDPELIESALTAAQLGNPARFIIDDKVSLPRQQSAMIPILDQAIDAVRVSIYNQSVQAKHPLLGLRMKNNSKQSLMSGPIAVYDNEQYAGDARIFDLQPGEERFIGFAIDTGVEIAPFVKIAAAPEVTVRSQHGQRHLIYRVRETTTYVVKNRSPDLRKVVIEQPVRNDWTFSGARSVVAVAGGKDKDLVWKAGEMEKPIERTRDMYRFVVDVKAGDTVKYEVTEESPRNEPFTNAMPSNGILGFNIWTDTKRTPEDTFFVEVVGGALKVSHRDRSTENYSFKNWADEGRTIWLEHVVPEHRRLVGANNPQPDGRLYRFKIELPANGTRTQSITEESATFVVDSYNQTKGDYRNEPPVGELPSERFITPLGFEVWRLRRSLPTTLINARFAKGEVATSTKDQEVFAYHIRNLDDQKRTFLLDHAVRPDCTLSVAEKPLQGRRDCYRFTLKVGEKIATREIVEESFSSRTEALSGLSAEQVKVLLASPAVAESVKENITKGRTLIQDLARTEALLKELQIQIKEITDEQTRIKGNLEKLPPGSDVHKRLIDKFDKQETALEAVQQQTVEKVGQRKSQRNQLDGFFEMVNGK